MLLYQFSILSKCDTGTLKYSSWARLKLSVSQSWPVGCRLPMHVVDYGSQ